ncbi:glycosyl hydrolase family 95 catalytic domain-containing protein [Haloferula sp.]|uniref:glycoside hydrolase family 95 protein n=1 Tax=Haloferula sp. TaxID=2497595 RepID=UPI00329FB41D
MNMFRLLVLQLMLCVGVPLFAQVESDIAKARKASSAAYSAALGRHQSDETVALLRVDIVRLNGEMRAAQEASGLTSDSSPDERTAIFKKLKSDDAYKKVVAERDDAQRKLNEHLAGLDPEYKAAMAALDKAVPQSAQKKRLPKTQTKLEPDSGRSVYQEHTPVIEKATTLWFQYPAKSWLEALPIGNGSFGAMTFGGLTKDVVQFNHDTLWTPPNLPEEIFDRAYPDKREEVEKIRKLIFEGKAREAHEVVRNDLLEKYDVGSYQPFGELLFDYSFGDPLKKSDVSKYHRQLDLETGVSMTTFEINGTTYVREVFVAHDSDVIVVRMRATGGGTFSADMSYFRPAHYEHQKPEVTSSGKNLISLSGKAHGEDETDYATSYQSLAVATSKGGEVNSEDGVLTVRDATEMTVYLSGVTNYNPENPFKPLGSDLHEECLALLKAASGRGAEQVKADSVNAHHEIFGRVDIVLGTDLKNDMSLDARVRASRELTEQEHDPLLTMQLFHMGRYLLMTSSRPGSMAANLRGIWNSELRPSWNSDYHHDINVQMSYWAAEVTNMTECHRPLFDLLKMAKPRGERVASEMFGARGVFLPLLHGIYMTAYPPTPPAAMWAMGGPWNATHIMEHYRFAGDKEYLRDVSYDLLKDYVLFCLDWLVEDPRTGKLVGGPDYSPETAFSTRPDGQKGDGWGLEDMGCAMDQQIIWQVFTDYLEASAILGIEDSVAEEVRTAMPRLAQTRIGADGTIMEWSEDYGSSEPDHRHISHMWGFYPGNQYHVDNAPKMLEAGKKTLDIRTDTERAGKKVSWSNLYYINFYARFGMGDQSLYWINNLNRIRGFNMNLMGSQGQVQDCNYGYPSGIAEMLLQSHTGEIKLLPALPSAWADGSVRGLIARGGFEISMKWEDGKLVDASILSKSDNTCSLRYKDKVILVNLKKGEAVRLNGQLSL